MRKQLLLLTAFLWACGGSDFTTIPEGGTDGTTGGDGSMNTGGDTGTGDAASDGTTIDGTTMMDGGVGMDGGDGGGPFPQTLSCLVLWLDANTGVTQVNGSVSKWADLSGKGNDATQAIASRQPHVAQGAIMGHDAIDFNANVGGSNGNVLEIKDSPSLQWGHGDFLIALVARFDNDPKDATQAGAATFYSKMNTVSMMYSTGPVFLGNIPGVMGYQTGLSLSEAPLARVSKVDTYNNGKFRLYLGRRANNVLELRVNATQVATMNGSSTDVSAPGLSATIGAQGDANLHRMNGRIAEMVACKGAISMQDLGSLEVYFMNKYGL